jgi:hypothetical protein
VPCSASRVVPGAHRVVGPGTHRGSGPREVHTTEGVGHHVAGELDELIVGTCTKHGEELVHGGAACPGWCTTSLGGGGGAWRVDEERFGIGRSPEGVGGFFSFFT